VEKGRHRSVFTAPHAHCTEEKSQEKKNGVAVEEPCIRPAIQLPCGVSRFRGHHVTSHPYLDLGQRASSVLLRSPLLVLDSQRRAALSLPLKSRTDGQTAREGSPGRHRGRSKAFVGRHRPAKSGPELRRFIDECRSYSGPCSFRGSSITSLR
jgi:hypothetical protein